MNTKRFISFILSIMMLFAICIPTAAVDGETESHRILYAGQSIPVGFVDVTNDDTNIYVKYQLEAPGWLIVETHVQVGEVLTDFHLNKGGNPQVGHFDYSINHDPGVVTWTEIVPLSDGPWSVNDKLMIATHAVIRKVTKAADPAVLLGTENIHPAVGAVTMEARIWQVTTTGVSTLIDNDLTPVRMNQTDNFNGNAYDVVNKRFYFSDYGKFGGSYYLGPSPLYFNDMAGNTLPAGILTGGASGGTFFEGAYYFISERSDDLWRVTFNADGTIATQTIIANIFNNSGKTLAFGDIDIRDEAGVDVIYGSATELPSGVILFFRINLDGTNYQVIKSGGLYGAGGTQISFGSDGVLYGVNARTPFDLFSIDTLTGDTSLIKVLPVALSDLASGPAVPEDIVETETAWANGTRFNTSGNWAMYFTYTVVPRMVNVGTVHVLSNGTAAVSGVLENGVNYLLKASGTYTFAPGFAPAGIADAKYNMRPSVGWVIGDTWAYPKTNWLQVMFENDPTGTVIGWTEGFNEDHVYTKAITGTGLSLSFQIYDDYYGDNSGSIQVDIYRLNY